MKLKYLFYLLIIFLFFQYSMAIQDVYILKDTGATACSFLIISFYMIRGTLKGSIKLPRADIALLFGVLALASALPLFFSAFQVLAARNLFPLFTAIVTVLIFTTLEEKEKYSIVSFFAFCSSLAVIYGLFQHAGLDIIEWGIKGRPLGTMGNPNLHSAFTALSLPIFFHLIAKGKTRRLYYMPVVLLSLISMYAAGSRAALLSAAIVFAVILIGLIPARFRLLSSVIILILAAAAAIPFRYKVIEAAGLRDFDTRMRALATASAAGMISARPLTGFGPGSFESIIPLYRKTEFEMLESKNNLRLDHAHNDYIEYAAEHGLLSAGVFLTFIFSSFFLLIKDGDKGLTLRKSLLYSYLTLLIIMLVDFPTHIAPGLFFFLFLPGAALSLYCGGGTTACLKLSSFNRIYYTFLALIMTALALLACAKPLLPELFLKNGSAGPEKYLTDPYNKKLLYAMFLSATSGDRKTEVLKKAEKTFPNADLYAGLLGVQYESAGDMPRAVYYYRKVRSLSPHHPFLQSKKDLIEPHD